MQMRSDAIRASNVAAAYVIRKVLTLTRELPWSLAVGDIDGNLAALAVGPEVEEATARKIQLLLVMGCNPHAIADGVHLFHHIHFPNTGVEQGHGSASAIHRSHRF